jgi:hypothetical protein
MDQERLDARVLEILENEWLGLGDVSLVETPYNPLVPQTQEDVERPDRFLLQTMMDPTYLGFFIEHVLNKTPHPLQVVIVQELWRRPFPLMVAARGAGKSFLLAVYFMAKAFLCQGIRIAITGAAFRQAKVVFEYCEEIWRNAPVLRDMCNSGDGPHRRREKNPWQAGRHRRRRRVRRRPAGHLRDRHRRLRLDRHVPHRKRQAPGPSAGQEAHGAHRGQRRRSGARHRRPEQPVHHRGLGLLRLQPLLPLLEEVEGHRRVPGRPQEARRPLS